jgi:hypothetical protein
LVFISLVSTAIRRLGVAVIVFLSVAGPAAGRTHTVSLAPFVSVDGVRLGSSPAEVRTVLGRPAQINHAQGRPYRYLYDRPAREINFESVGGHSVVAEISAIAPFDLADGLRAGTSSGSTMADVRRAFGHEPHFRCSPAGCSMIRNATRGAGEIDFVFGSNPPARLIGITFAERPRLRSSGQVEWWLVGGAAVAAALLGAVFVVSRRRRALLRPDRTG